MDDDDDDDDEKYDMVDMATNSPTVANPSRVLSGRLQLIFLSCGAAPQRGPWPPHSRGF